MDVVESRGLQLPRPVHRRVNRRAHNIGDPPHRGPELNVRAVWWQRVVVGYRVGIRAGSFCRGDICCDSWLLVVKGEAPVAAAHRAVPEHTDSPE